MHVCNLLIGYFKDAASDTILRPSDSVRKILGNNVEFPRGHIMRQERSYYAAN